MNEKKTIIRHIFIKKTCHFEIWSDETKKLIVTYFIEFCYHQIRDSPNLEFFHAKTRDFEVF